MDNRFFSIQINWTIRRKDRWLCSTHYMDHWEIYVPCVEPNGDMIDGQSYSKRYPTFWIALKHFLFAEIEPYHGIDGSGRRI